MRENCSGWPVCWIIGNILRHYFQRANWKLHVAVSHIGTEYLPLPIDISDMSVSKSNASRLSKNKSECNLRTLSNFCVRVRFSFSRAALSDPSLTIQLSQNVHCFRKQKRYSLFLELKQLNAKACFTTIRCVVVWVLSVRSPTITDPNVHYHEAKWSYRKEPLGVIPTVGLIFQMQPTFMLSVVPGLKIRTTSLATGNGCRSWGKGLMWANRKCSI